MLLYMNRLNVDTCNSQEPAARTQTSHGCDLARVEEMMKKAQILLYSKSLPDKLKNGCGYGEGDGSELKLRILA
jgi:hypothetical protein